MSANDLALAVDFAENGLVWRFTSEYEARQHLRRYERLIAHWALQCAASKGALIERFRAIVQGGGKEWAITPRPMEGTVPIPELNPIAAVSRPDFTENKLLIAQHWLNEALLEVLLEMKRTPGIAALVNWETQKQVVMTESCEQIPVGEQLADCLRFARQDYWVSEDLDRFFRDCRQSETVEAQYLTFDPLLGGDWIRIVSSYRMIDAGELGLYQLGRNVAFERVEEPVRV